MKIFKLAAIAFLFTFVSSCINSTSCEKDTNKNRKFTGYIVEKEYIPSHRRDVTPQKQITNTPVPMAPIIAYRMNEDRKEEEIYNAEILPAEWTWFIANRYEIISYKVDSTTFDTKQCGEQVTVIVN